MNKENTREKILAAASEVFCDKGFAHTTIRDICAAADVNVAAVNYHFGDKKQLYLQVLSQWMTDFVADTAMEQTLASDAPPEERLHEYFRAELSILLKDNDVDGKALNKIRLIIRQLTEEDHDPQVFDCHKSVEEKLVFPVITELVGTNLDEETLTVAIMAVTSLTTHYFLAVVDNPEMAFKTEKELDQTADLLSTFALGGLQSIKEKINA